MRVTFGNGVLSAEADTFGGELTSVKLHGRERLWQGLEWPRHAPVLFPVCGNCEMRLDGTVYPVGRHGFASKSEFSLVEQGGNAVCFELTSNEQTKIGYPFAFCFRVRYILDGATLKIVYEVENRDEKTMYFSCGGHESFALSRPLGEYELHFPEEEVFEHLEHDGEGRLTGEKKSFGCDIRLPVPEGHLRDGRTLIFSDLRSRRVALCEKGGKPLAEICFEGFSNLLLWRVGEQKMICIEPWLNLPDGAVRGEFSKKAGVVALLPQETKKFVREINYFD